MSFASAIFLLAFLPLVLTVFHLIRGNAANAWRARWLLLASLLFYAWSGVADLLMLVGSLAFNFIVGRALSQRAATGVDRGRVLVGAAIVANVVLLVAYKALAATHDGGSAYLSAAGILIPLGLSFVTFQQIAFLLDCHRGRVRALPLRDYLLFITFFPQLVMGPIVHFRQLAPQLAAGHLARRSLENFCVGLAIFAVGLFKKLVIADALAPPVDRIFAAAGTSADLNLIDAWAGAIGFQLQLYMDFTGYADMAIGLARMFNINLPINYDRPYHAISRFDLWRRWHLTFVEFMRSNVFQPLARLGWMPMWASLTITGMASGLWHGFGGTFILWGLVQTVLLLLSHYWGRWRRRGGGAHFPRIVPLQIAITFAVSAAVGVLFRAPSLEAAGRIWLGLGAFDSLALPQGLATIATAWGLHLDAAATALDLIVDLADALPYAFAAAMIWILPQTSALFASYWSAIEPRAPRQVPVQVHGPAWLRFELSIGWGLFVAVLLLISLASLDAGRRFVYFQF